MAQKITLHVDDREIEAEEGTILLQVCLDNDIYIPNLCYLKERKKAAASCRLCFVEIGGENKPVTSCTTRVREGMTVRTDTPEIRALQKTAFELLMSTHNVDCKNCPANKRCELQKIAKFLHTGLKPKRIEKLEREIPVEEHPFLQYFPDKCVLCGRCIDICERVQGRPYLTFARRGFNMFVSFYGEESPDDLPCGSCYQCVEICPVAALRKRDMN